MLQSPLRVDMKQAQELVCGAKLKGVSTRKVHSMRREHMKSGPVTSVKFRPDDGSIEEIRIPEAGAPYGHLVEEAQRIQAAA